MNYPSNVPYFTFKISGCDQDLRVLSFTGTEKVSSPFSFTLELVTEKKITVPMRKLLGHEALLQLFPEAPAPQTPRPVHGIVHSFFLLETGQRFTRYQCEIVPRFCLLDKTTDHRIFQHLSIIDIIEKLLKEHRLTTNDYRLSLKDDYPKREYCVQYAETDLHFISRLLEEEGVRYYFEHTKDNHIMVFHDAWGGTAIAGEQEIAFHQHTGMVPDAPVVSAVTLHEEVRSGSVTLREWSFTKPRLNLESFKKVGPDELGENTNSWENLEVYRYPDLYQLRTAGERYAQLELERHQSWNRWLTGESNTHTFIAGHIFTLTDHPAKDINCQWQLVEVVQSGEQPQVLEETAGERPSSYNVRFKALPEAIIYRPAAVHEKHIIEGLQTALVTGPKSEEIYVDEYGRVKVQFFWDREGKNNEKTTCWVRVSQGWAGGQYGTMAIPRIGHEVIVNFLEGNPDRPLITGRTYHGLNLPPYELPLHMTRTVFKSYSSPGGNGYNELRVEDKKGEEEIYMHAEKDVNVYVKNDWKEHILRDRHSTVDRDRYEHVLGQDHLLVDNDSMVELKKNSHTTVGRDTHIKVGNRYLHRSGTEIHLKAGQKVTLEAGTELTAKAGGSFIKLSPAGIIISGSPTTINSGGAPGSGSGAGPKLPLEALLVDKGTVPKGVEVVEVASTLPSTDCMADQAANRAPLCTG